MEVMWSTLILISSIYIFFKLMLKLAFPKNRNLPPTPPSLPIIGHLHLLKPPTHLTLSDRYGLILRLKYGYLPVVVISSSSAAEQCFTENDVAFAYRPKSLAGQHLGYSHTSIGFVSYGDHWHNLRRVTAIQIFSSASLHLSSVARNEEIWLLAGKLFRASDGSAQKLNMNSVFTDFVFNVVMRMVAGKRWTQHQETRCSGRA